MDRRVALVTTVLCLGGGLAACTSSPVTPDVLVRVAADAYLRNGRTPAVARDPELATGRSGTEAMVSYLRFQVTEVPRGTGRLRSTLTLTPLPGAQPGLVELVSVPDTGWSERTLASRAPQVGRVIGTSTITTSATALTFDVSRVVQSTGKYAFALTSPDGLLKFRSSEAPSGAPTLRLTREDPRTGRWQDPASPTPADDPGTTPPSPGGPSPTPSPDPGSASDPVPPPQPPTEPVPPSGDPVPPTGEPSPIPDPNQPSPGPTAPQSSPSPAASTPAPAQPSPSPSTPGPDPTQAPVPTPSPAAPSPSASPSVSPGPTVVPTEEPEEPPAPACTVGPKLVPTCGILTGVAPAAHTNQPRDQAMREFEATAGRPQQIFHHYHRGEELFPTPWEVALAREPGHERLLFLNWKPLMRWDRVAAGDYDRVIDRLAAHIRSTYTDPFYLTVHHEPENDVIAREGSGMTARDYAAMFRHVVERLRAKGVTNAVTVMCYMSYVPWNVQPWFGDLYPGDDVIDWVSWDVYAYSEAGFGYGDFVEMVNRTLVGKSWPGIYSWAARTFPDKPLMVAEWGVWQSGGNPGHKPWFFATTADQMALFPRVKALVYFDSPNAEGRDSRIDATPQAAAAFRGLMSNRMFDVRLPAR
ncbi:DNRLRE domain-containing protein [Longispora sp. K20-0274]|uniref:DNRLRE domain-containing protein n=1 Tax=Longispora sp. K20-0274 TaxID=3088255 RepID=UPI00399B6AF8